MALRTGMELLQAVAERILAAYLEERDDGPVEILDGSSAGRRAGVDLIYRRTGASGVSVKVKADPYQGSDPSLINDRSLVFYRPGGEAYAFESISDSRTNAPGWMLSSAAQELFYYRIALAQSEAEVSALMSEPDPVFFGELRVESDSLDILPMAKTQEWFENNLQAYAPRPVSAGDHMTWVRLVPARDIAAAVPGVSNRGPVFRLLGIVRRSGSEQG